MVCNDIVAYHALHPDQSVCSRKRRAAKLPCTCARETWGSAHGFVREHVLFSTRTEKQKIDSMRRRSRVTPFCTGRIAFAVHFVPKDSMPHHMHTRSVTMEDLAKVRHLCFSCSSARTRGRARALHTGPADRVAGGDPRAWPCTSKLVARRSTPRSATGAVWARSGCRGPCAIPGAPAEKGLRPGVAVGTVVFIT